MRIDGHTYRRAESLAREHLPTWEYAQIHRVAFVHSSFPQELQSHLELPQVMNIMQENRFDAFQKESSGYTSEDVEMIVNALADYVVFHRQNFPHSLIKLPISTMISSYLIYKKLVGYNPQASSILEVGPGSGNVSFFLKHHKPLKNYTTIEACEAYYLLQNLVYTHNFGLDFEEKAFPRNPENNQQVISTCSHFEEPQYLKVENHFKATHYPWWRNREVYDQKNEYDIITSNANLMEFSPQALADYLHIFKQVLKEDGVILCQCLGGPLNGKVKDLLKTLRMEGFGALMVAKENAILKTQNHPDKFFGLNQGVFVREGHPLYEKASQNLLNHNFSFLEEDSNLVNAFFPSETGRQQVTEGDLIQQLQKTLQNRQVETSLETARLNVPQKTLNEITRSQLIGARNEIISLYQKSLQAKVAIYGAGTHTQLLLKHWSSVIGQPIEAIIVTEPDFREFEGITVLGINEVSIDQFDGIVLSSMNFEDEMQETLQEYGIQSSAIRLYS